MRVYFYGPYKTNGGPAQVNKNLVLYIKSLFHTKECTIKIFSKIEDVIKLLPSKVVIFSGLVYNNYQVNIAKALGKKIIYIMHGCIKIEQNNKYNDYEENILKQADLILCVSQTFKLQMSTLFPLYKDKMEVLMNGVNWQEIDEMKKKLSHTLQRESTRIILFGGGRVTKKNIYVCRAVHRINQELKTNYHIDIYGYYRNTDDSKYITDIDCVTFHHVIPHTQVNIELSKAKLFIQNSIFEPFGLSVMDALMCGCDILLSQYVGAKDIISGLNEDDIIYNPSDVEEIKRKIEYVLMNSNNQRLISSVDRESTSLKSAAMKLIEYCKRYA